MTKQKTRESNKEGLLTIGEFSEQTNVPVDTLRYYEKIGLLKPEHRSLSGYRLYGEENLASCQFILSAKALGFSLDTIKTLLNIQIRKQDASCEDVKQFVQLQLSALDERLAELKKVRRAMSKLHESCCGGDEDVRFCSILKALEQGNV